MGDQAIRVTEWLGWDMVGPTFFTHTSLVFADAFSDTGYKTMVQLGIYISQKRHSTRNCTQIHPLRQVITNSFLNTLHAMLKNAFI